MEVMRPNWQPIVEWARTLAKITEKIVLNIDGRP